MVLISGTKPQEHSETSANSMTSWYGKPFRIISTLWWESTGQRRSPPPLSACKMWGHVMWSFGVFLTLVRAKCWTNYGVGDFAAITHLMDLIIHADEPVVDVVYMRIDWFLLCIKVIMSVKNIPHYALCGVYIAQLHYLIPTLSNL